MESKALIHTYYATLLLTRATNDRIFYREDRKNNANFPASSFPKKIDNEVLQENGGIRDYLSTTVEQKLLSSFHMNQKKVPIVYL